MKILWNNCKPLYVGGKWMVYANKRYRSKAKKLLDKYGEADIWIDASDGKAFSISENSFQGASGRDRSFLSPASRFLTYPDKFCPDCGGKIFCDQTLGKLLGTNTIATTEFVMQDVDVFKKVRGKTVMIVAGGPSALRVDWTKYNYDYLWSCNHFFLNKDLKGRKVDLWIPSDEVDLLHNKKLHGYLERFPDSWCCLYPTVKMKMDYLKQAKARIPNMTYSHLRYRSKIGIAPRLILLAIFSGAKNIFFVGMDGLPGRSVPHAFEKVKAPKGTASRHGAAGVFRKQYVQFWDYVLNHIRPDVEFFNLGEGISTNLSTDISRDRFPLKRLTTDRKFWGLVKGKVGK